MDWIDSYDLFLFDFDGLLVKTEHIHYQAYVNTLKNRGFDLGWSFQEFCQNAHLESTGLKEAIYAKFPDLQEQQPTWDIIYKEKKSAYLELLISSKIELMPGVEDLLLRLDRAKKNSCVVTNSVKEHTDLIVAQLPILKTISHWITREDYILPKPSSECYLRAIELYEKKGNGIIGFEDTIKGLKALIKTPAQPVLISSSKAANIQAIEEGSFIHYESLEKIPLEKI